ncbi:MAG: ImmA/IrrE family metallo-endopeptidase [Pyrinomonadaceae bacterium MAG19_C2-C3]|nr:ImmA/IrrE family metallo-endopeptidase [Pyrinomonadaceae bacterium MAG19_C2-C3]
MNFIPQALLELGYNKRCLTYEDFERLCEREGINLLRLNMKTDGMYLVRRGRHCIALASHLRGVRLWLVAYHELTHYFLHPPALRFFTRGTLSKVEHQAQMIAICCILPAPLMDEILRHGRLHDFPPDLMKLRRRIFDLCGM